MNDGDCRVLQLVVVGWIDGKEDGWLAGSSLLQRD